MTSHALIVLAASLALAADAAGQANAIELYGELHVDESGTRQPLPQTFQIVLRNVGQTIIGRETVTTSGRYRFRGLGRGEFSLAVEVQGVEVARIEFYLSGLGGTAIRKDIELGWKDVRADLEAAAAAARTPLLYARDALLQETYENARTEMEAGNLSAASELLAGLVERDPGDYEALTDLGTVQYRLGRHTEAERSYRQAVERRGNYTLAWLNLGRLQFETTDYPEALLSLERAVELEPDLAEAHLLLGEVYLQLKRGSQALTHFNRCLELDPEEMAEAHLRLAALYSAAGYRDRAVAELRLFLQRRPDSPRRAEVEAALGELSKPPGGRE